MSRLAKRLLSYPDTVTLEIANKNVLVKGPMGELSQPVDSSVVVAVDGSAKTVGFTSPDLFKNPKLGLYWSLVKNMIAGVVDGFKINMELVGVGYKVEKTTGGIRLYLGYSHPIDFASPDGISIEVESPTRFSICGVNNQQVGQVAANIFKLRKPDAYKGKGVRYSDRRPPRLKQGKSVK
ncbi:50S ribosomal protein L6 [bacterium]|jgi:large subunit ribosomal protein L6|nr:50S ribosomal protein L6 [bacterium]|tara:strand:+ start:4699 stop:5238 length:540 start_codon:yes stop_codon:yes gene_type:complete